MLQSEADELIVAIDQDGFPCALRHVHDPPRRLYVRGYLAGQPRALAAPAIAVVGARDATAYGLAIAQDLGRGLAEAGLTVVSGLALGIDAAAHRGALAAGGTTIAVVGSGTDVVYPRQNRALRASILEQGAVVSEYQPGTVPLKGYFPRRNRIISGLSLGVVVVEATLKSGSLSTARHAVEQGREVFAVPGPVGALRSLGPHSLLKAGAKLVESVDDILAELPLGIAAPPPEHLARPKLSPSLASILEGVRSGADTADGLAARSGRRVAEILTDLLSLELRGLVVRGPGGRYGAAGNAVASGTAHAGRGVDSAGGDR